MEEKSFTVTRAWIEQHASGKNHAGWTRKQLEAIGIEWPPRHGWKRRAEGMRITDNQRARFERWLA